MKRILKLVGVASLVVGGSAYSQQDFGGNGELKEVTQKVEKFNSSVFEGGLIIGSGHYQELKSVFDENDQPVIDPETGRRVTKLGSISDTLSIRVNPEMNFGFVPECAKFLPSGFSASNFASIVCEAESGSNDIDFINVNRSPNVVCFDDIGEGGQWQKLCKYETATIRGQFTQDSSGSEQNQGVKVTVNNGIEFVTTQHLTIYNYENSIGGLTPRYERKLVPIMTGDIVTFVPAQVKETPVFNRVQEPIDFVRDTSTEDLVVNFDVEDILYCVGNVENNIYRDRNFGINVREFTVSINNKTGETKGWLDNCSSIRMRLSNLRSPGELVEVSLSNLD